MALHRFIIILGSTLGTPLLKTPAQMEREPVSFVCNLIVFGSTIPNQLPRRVTITSTSPEGCPRKPPRQFPSLDSSRRIR